jgi:broad-specificity NMP kinase
MVSTTYVAIIGIDGSGKSTCFRETLNRLAGSCSIIGIGDRVLMGKKREGILELQGVRRARLKKWLMTTAKDIRNPYLYKTCKLLELVCWSDIQQDLRARYRPDMILGDGSPMINTLGWGIRYRPRFFEHDQCLKAISYLSGARIIPLSQAFFYLRNIREVFLLNTLGLGRFPIPDVVFLLRVSPQVAMERIMARGKKLQVHETAEFLGRLQNAYASVCEILKSDLGRRVYEIQVDKLTIDETVTIIVNDIRDSSETA